MIFVNARAESIVSTSSLILASEFDSQLPAVVLLASPFTSKVFVLAILPKPIFPVSPEGTNAKRQVNRSERGRPRKGRGRPPLVGGPPPSEVRANFLPMKSLGDALPLVWKEIA